MKQSYWNMVLAHIPKSASPFQYLDQFLSSSQLACLLSYEHRSTEQIEKLIQMLDPAGFCDEGLRKKVFDLLAK
jgi:hypothetical protein